jgi:hypothetical protein
MAGLARQVAHLRALAILDPDTTALQQAMINMLEELAEAVDGLRGRAQGDAGS